MEEENKNWYDKSYKLLLIIPAVLLIFCLVYLYGFVQDSGDIIKKDVTLTGGTSISVFTKDFDIKNVENSLKTEFPDLKIREINDFRSGKTIGFFIETKADAEPIKNALEKYLGYELNQENSSIEFTGETISSGFYKQMRNAIIIAFVLMSLVVFLVFRTFVPSLAVILSAFADIVMTITLVDILGMEVSIAGIIAFLMLIGYSVDTDILLTSRLIKRNEGSVNERIWGAFKTGMTMTLTSIAAVAVSLFIIYNFSETLRQIFTILLIGLGFDIFNTWITNASILKLYVERKGEGYK